MKFYDLHIELADSRIHQIVEFAEKLGYSGIAICSNQDKFRMLKEEISKVQSKVEIYAGVIIEARDASELNELVNKFRENATIVIVSGGDYNINRAACENSKVDILAHPEINRNDSGLDEVCLNAAAQNNVAIEVNFAEILHGFRGTRANILNKIATNIMLCDKLRVPLIVCSGAKSVWDMRDPRELVSILNALDLDLGKAFNAVTSLPMSIVETNKKKLEGKMPTEGVEVA